MDVSKAETRAEMDLHAYWRVILKRRWLFGATLFLVAACFLGWTMRSPKIYQATATVVIDPQAPKVLAGQQDVVELGAGNFFDNRDYYNTQIRILHSRWLAEEVAHKSKTFRKDKRIIPNPSPTATDAELDAIVASYVQAGLRVLPIRDSRVFQIAFADRDADLAAEIANAVSDEYIFQNRDVKTGETKKARGWVSKQLDEAQKDLDKSETALYTYKKDNNILSMNLEERQNVISKALDDFSHALTETQKKRIELAARRRAIASIMSQDPAEVPSTYVAQSETIGPLRAAYLEERRKLKVLTDKYGDKWPDVIAQQARVTSALDDVKAEGQAMVRSIDAEIRALTETQTSYEEQVKGLKEEALDLNQKEISYKRLQREAQNAEQNYSSLLKRLNESEQQEADVANNIRQLDLAVAPHSPIEPRLKQAVVFGLGAGLMLAIVLVFLAEVLDRTVKSQEDIEGLLGLPFLGLVPSVDQQIVRSARELHVVEQPMSSVAECCRVVRTNILFCSPDKPLRSLLITSSSPVEGKTMTVVNLGAVMAQSGQRTLLVDSDMRRPRLHKIFQASNEHGLSRVILDHATLDDAVKTTDVPGLYLLPCGPMPPNPAELLQTEKFSALVAKLTEKFDRVIFDSPPLLAVTDAAILGRVVDGSVMVVRAGRTPRDAVYRSHSQLAAVNARLIGVILNHVDLRSPHYASYYNYKNKYYAAQPAEAAGKASKG